MHVKSFYQGKKSVKFYLLIKIRIKIWKFNPDKVIIFCIAFQSAIYLYPNMGNFWVYSLVIGTCLFLIGSDVPSVSNFIKSKGLRFTLIIFLASSLFLNGLALTQPGKNFESEILKGMKDTELNSRVLDKRINILVNLKWDKFLNLCDSGILAIYDGKYRNYGPKYVDANWTNYIDITQYEKSVDKIILCGQAIDRLTYFQKLGFVVQYRLLDSRDLTYYLVKN